MEDLGSALAEKVGELSEEDINPGFVDVRPDVTVDADLLEGAMVLELGQVTEVESVRYRFGLGEFLDAKPTEEPPDFATGERRYSFEIPLDADTDTVQLEVRQADRFSTRRTFTYRVPPEGRNRTP